MPDHGPQTYLSVADHVRPFMATIYLIAHFQHDVAPWHKAKFTSDWFHIHDDEFFSVLPGQNPVEHLWDVVEQEICSIKVHLKNLQDVTRVLKECFQHLVESML